MNPELVVFDLGGVLCEFSPKRRLYALSDASGLPPDEVALRLDDCGLIDRADRGQLTRDAEYELAVAALGLACDYPTYRSLWCRAFKPYPDVIAIARAVRLRLRTAILTNNGPVLLDALTHDLSDVGRGFDDIFVSAMFHATKPEEIVFRGVESKLGVPPGNLLLIDDSMPNVAGALRCGWQGIHFTSAAQLDQELQRALDR
jgi:glucose-1-phosphatase